MAFGYYKEGAHNPTFAYISKALEAEKVIVMFVTLCIWRATRACSANYVAATHTHASFESWDSIEHPLQ